MEVLILIAEKSLTFDLLNKVLVESRIVLIGFLNDEGETIYFKGKEDSSIEKMYNESFLASCCVSFKGKYNNREFVITINHNKAYFELAFYLSFLDLEDRVDLIDLLDESFEKGRFQFLIHDSEDEEDWGERFLEFNEKHNSLKRIKFSR